MSKYKLRDLILIALFSDIGLFAKRIIAPIANIITDSLRIPGGIGAAFSIMFVVLASVIIEKKGCAVFISLTQSVIALALGMIGNLGALSLIGYIVPGICIDIILWIFKKLGISKMIAMIVANMFGAITASLIASFLVFHLNGMVLLLYLLVSATSGLVFGYLGYELSVKIRYAISCEQSR